MIGIRDAVEYDVAGNWLAGKLRWFPILRMFWVNHLKRKAHRKYERYANTFED